MSCAGGSRDGHFALRGYVGAGVHAVPPSYGELSVRRRGRVVVVVLLHCRVRVVDAIERFDVNAMSFPSYLSEETQVRVNHSL